MYFVSAAAAGRTRTVRELAAPTAPPRGPNLHSARRRRGSLGRCSLRGWAGGFVRAQSPTPRLPSCEPAAPLPQAFRTGSRYIPRGGRSRQGVPQAASGRESPRPQPAGSPPGTVRAGGGHRAGRNRVKRTHPAPDGPYKTGPAGTGPPACTTGWAELLHCGSLVRARFAVMGGPAGLHPRRGTKHPCPGVRMQASPCRVLRR